MGKRSLAVLVFVLTLVCLVSLTSCEEAVVDQGYSTPTLTGKISIPSDAGLSGSDFFIQVMDGDNAVYTGSAGSDGSFTVSGLDSSKSYDVLVTTEEPESFVSKSISKEASKGYGGWLSNVTATIGQANNVGSVKVKPLGTIKGKISIDDLENTIVNILIPGTSYIGTPDENGDFAISNVPQASYRLKFMAVGYLSKTVTDVVLYSENDAESPEITVAPVELVRNAGTVVGTATLDGVVNCSGIVVRLEAEDGTNYTSTTSSTGTYRIDDVAPGTYKAIVSYSDYPAVSSSEIIVEAGKTSIVKDNLLLIENRGTVTGSAGLSDSDIISGINVLLSNKDIGYTYSTVTGTDGTFTLQVKPGSYTATASYANYDSQSCDVVVGINAVSNITIPNLNASNGSINGKLLLEGETNYSGATVAAIQTSDESQVYSTTTLEDGSYYIGGILPGTYSIQIQKSGFVTDRSQTAVVSGGNSTSVNSVTLSSTTSTVKGTVTLDGSNDHTGITILLKATDERIQYDTSTDQNGNYTLTKVIPGSYVLYASKAGYETKTINDLTVETSTTKTIDTQNLAIGIRSITGSVELELKNDHAGALVTATNCSDPTDIYSAITNTSGSYTLAGMNPGEYEIVISYTGYRSVTLPTVNVVSDSTVDNGLTELSINRGTIYGKATLEGRTSSSGVKVDLYKGTELYETKYTDEVGSYSFYVPQGNYSGILFSMEDFRSESDQRSISLFAEGLVSIAAVELEATHNTVKGIADVLTTEDDSAVTISFDDHSELGSFVTISDGVFQFDHVPVGSYTLRFERDNCSDITLPVEVIAADEINVGTIKITPNTGSITGKVNLENGTSLSGVNVEVDMGTETLSTTTDSSGRYEIGGVSIADVYTVTYSKDGWDSKTQQINPALTKLEVREMDEITLVDTTAPVLNSVVINSGANTAADKDVTLHFDVSESGCGVTKVMVTYDNVFDRTVTRHDYLSSMEWSLPSGNGLKTIYVKVVDASGNESNTVSASVTLTDQKKEVSGVLTGDDLHWTKELSPYLVIGNILVPNDKDLIIDSGVDVQFAGAYSITIEGNIYANGTESEGINFYGIEGGKNTWKGIISIGNLNYDGETYNSGCLLKNVNIYDADIGVSGTMWIEDSSIVANKPISNIKTMHGVIKNTLFKGDTNLSVANELLIKGCSFEGNFNLVIEYQSSETIHIKDCSFEGFTNTGKESTLYFYTSRYENLLIEDSIFSNYSNFEYRREYCDANSYNHLIERTTFIDIDTITCNGFVGETTFAKFDYCHFENINCISLIPDNADIQLWKNNVQWQVNNSNIINVTKIECANRRNISASLDFSGNFWGYDKTREINTKGAGCNMSFIEDFYDNYDYSEILYSDWDEEPIAEAGRRVL